MRGRKPKPTHLKIITGNAGKRKLNLQEPQAKGELSGPDDVPGDFTDDQAALWQYAIEHAPKGVLRKIDRDVLRAWVVAADLHRKATKEIEDEGILTRGAEGQLMKNPAVMVLRDATSMMMRAAEQMGFSPTARTRIKVPDAKPIDPKIPGRQSKAKRPPPEDPATEYARRVVRGEQVACKWVILACKRHLDDLKRQGARFDFVFDAERANKVCAFIQLMPHVKGPLAGQLIVLEPWQLFIVRCIFGWVHKKTGARRFRRVYIEVPRGNAKSTLSSGIGLYMLAADGEGGAEVYAAATTRDQAKVVFQAAQQMARKAKGFKEHFGVDVLAHNIAQISSGSKFEAVSSDADTLDGFNVHLAIVDELHAHKTRSVHDVMETAIGKRLQSMLFEITTAGTNLAGICYEVRTYLTKVLQGIAADDAFFGIIYTIDDGDNWTEPAAWEKANPNWGVSVMPDVIAGLAAKAMQMPAAQANFKTKHLDVWQASDQAYFDMRAWNACADPDLDIEDFEGVECIGAMDLASKVDVAERVLMFRRIIDEVEHYYCFARHYLPDAAIIEARNSQYSGWQVSGRLITTPGDVLDFDRIRDDWVDDSKRFQITEIAYDPWQALQMALQLQGEGATVIEYRNTVANFSAPMKELDALTRQRRLHHDGDPVLAWMVSNVVAHLDAKENVYPRKERPENKIDGVVALIMALGRWMAARAMTTATQAFVEI